MNLPKTFEEWWRDSGQRFNDPVGAQYAARDLWFVAACAGINSMSEKLKQYDSLNTQQNEHRQIHT